MILSHRRDQKRLGEILAMLPGLLPGLVIGRIYEKEIIGEIRDCHYAADYGDLASGEAELGRY